MKYTTALLALLFSLLASWLAIWGANIFIYILSLPFSLFGMALEDSGVFESGFIGFLYYAIKTGIIYFITFSFVFYKIYRSVSEGYHWFDALMLALAAFLIISFCDPDVTAILPDFMIDFQCWLHESCNYHLIAGVNWGDFDFSGGYVSDMQYLVFDVAVILAAIMGFIVSDSGD